MSQTQPESGPPRPAAPILNAPPVVLALLGAIVAVFVAAILLPPGPVFRAETALAFAPAKLAHVAGWPTLVTHVFLHGNLAHVLFNSLWLLAFGTPVARRFRALGAVADLTRAPDGRPGAPPTLAFLALFLGGGVAGALASAAMDPGSWTLLIGASGAVSALLGALVRFGFAPRRDDDPFALAPLTARSTLTWTAVVVGLNLLFLVPGFGAALGAGANEVAWEAHLGGYAFGLLALPALDRAVVGRL